MPNTETPAVPRNTVEQLVRDLVRQLRDTQQYAYSIEAEYRFHNAPPYHSAVSSRNYKRTEALLERAEAWIAKRPAQPDPSCVLPIIILDAHNDELDVRRLYMAQRWDGKKELVIATNAEPEQ